MRQRNEGPSLTLIAILLAILLMITAGSFIVMKMTVYRISRKGSLAGEAAPAEYQGHYAFIHTGEDDDLWNNIYEGARQRGSQSGIFVEYFGENLTSTYDRNALLSMATDAGVDGIIIDGAQSEALSALIAAAAKSGIPVITVFTDCADSERICFAGVSRYSIGRQYGGELIKRAPDGRMHICVLMNPAYAGSGQDLVITGISDVFAEQGREDDCVIEGTYINDETPFTAEEDIRTIFIGQTLPDAIVALNSVYTRCLYQAAVDYNKVGEVGLYGFHDSEDILMAVEKGILEATVAVDASELGAAAVDALNEYRETGYVSNYVEQDTRIISSLNLREENHGQNENEAAAAAAE